MRSAHFAWLSLVVLIASMSACTSILGGFDFNGNGGKGTGGSSTSTSSSMSTTTGHPAASSSTGTGGAGTGGMPVCTACAAASNCPTPASDCEVASCDNNCCGTKPLALDTKCSTQGGQHCDGNGKCVACVVSAECPMPPTLCQTPSCTSGACSNTNAAAGTTCNDNGGQVCNAGGQCVACQMASDCPGTGTTCATPACAGGACTPMDAASGASCNDSGGTVCDGNGKCVACVKTSDCPATGTVCAVAACSSNACAITNAAQGTACTDNGGTVCDGNGKCVAMHCTDGIKDGDETGQDCGGSCSPCGDGGGCKGPGDCKSGYCVGSPIGTCTACAMDIQCAGGSFCNTTSGTCTPTQAGGSPCAGPDQCTSGFCVNGVCCDGACNGTCQGCTMALTGGIDGKCASLRPGTAAPAGQCTASPPCGNDGRCAAGGVCEQQMTGTACGTSCANGTLTNLQCNGSGSCKAGSSSACPNDLECAGTTSCLSSCAMDTDCAMGFYCTAGTCKPQGTQGAACAGNNECTSSFCVSGVCCNGPCNGGPCQACAAALTGFADGVCGVVKDGLPDPRGVCMMNAPASCGTNGTCKAGSCADWPSGTDCTTVCSNGTQQTSSCNGSGTCQAGTPKACSPFVCGAGACKTSCGTHADCVQGDFCQNGACVSAIAISAGPSSYHTCVLTSAGGVQCWGYNNAGQLGNGVANGQSQVPVGVIGLSSGVTQIAVGDRHTCALVSGAVQCWGDNSNAQLGVNPTTTGSSSTPISVPGLPAGIKAIGAGGYHNCAITSSGGVMCWGFNSSGQLGNNNMVTSFMPVNVVGLGAGVLQVAGGESHTCAVTSASGVQCWGSGGSGQLGNNMFANSAVPVAVTGLPAATFVACGENHTCALTSSGGVQCWGEGNFGELGNNTNTGSAIPVAVTGVNSGITAICTGSYHSCAVSSSGPIQCWGYNPSGQLGNNTTTNSLVQVSVQGLAPGAKFCAAGQQFTCAITGSGPQCWGDNSLDELGDNNTTNSLLPVNVAEP